MIRTQISLTEEERRLLNVAAAESGRSISSLIRDAVQLAYGAEHSLEGDLATMREAFGSWNARTLDAADWVDEIRTGSRLGDSA